MSEETEFYGTCSKPINQPRRLHPVACDKCLNGPRCQMKDLVLSAPDKIKRCRFYRGPLL